MRHRLLLASALPWLAWTATIAGQPGADTRGGSFMRFEEDESGARLQTGAASYRNRDGVTVDLIGAIHIADRAYYEKLNQRFTRYETLLYEMVGEPSERRAEWRKARARVEAAEPGEHGSHTETQSKKTLADRVDDIEKFPHHADHAQQDLKQLQEADQERAASGNLAWLHPLYETMEKSLGLTGQMNGIDYGGANFVHADMSARQFALMQKKKSESFLSLWWKTVVVQMEHPEVMPRQPGLLKVMEVLCRKDSGPELRRLMGRMFGDIEGMLSGLESENGTVILAERNKVALGVMQDQIKLGRKNLAIFYGAAHLPDMEKRLLAMGFVRTSSEWFTAWDLPPEPKAEVEVER